MKIAIISDSHDNLENLNKVFQWLQKNGVKIVIHCGDVGLPETLIKAAENYDGVIHFIVGNMDHKDLFEQEFGDKRFDNLKFYGEVGEIEIENIKIAFCHKPGKAEELAKSNKYDVVFYGHTHTPWIKKVGQVFLVNPGELAGQISQPSFALYDPEESRLDLRLVGELQ